MGKFCTQCGTKAEEEANFCYHCGKKLASLPSWEVPEAMHIEKPTRYTEEKVIDFGIIGSLCIDSASCTFVLELYDVKVRAGLFSYKRERGKLRVKRRFPFSKLLHYNTKDQLTKHRASKQGEKITGRPELQEQQLCVDIIVDDLNSGSYTIDFGSFYSMVGESKEYKKYKEVYNDLIAALEYIKAHINDEPIDTLYDIVLVKAGQDNMAFMKALIGVRKMGFFETMSFLQHLPATLVDGVSSGTATQMKHTFEQCGAEVLIQRTKLD